jgi:hypothetical protein
MKKITSKQVAKTATGVALVVLLAGQWALVTGPLNALDELGQQAAKQSNIVDVATYGGLHLLMLIGLPLVFGAIALCVVAAYMAFSKMESRQAELVYEIKKELK